MVLGVPRVSGARMDVTTARREGLAQDVVAPATAFLMVAVQVGSSTARDGVFLSSFPVTTLPWLVAITALVSFPAAGATSALLTRFGPRRVVPGAFVLSGSLFVAEAALLHPRPATASVVLYLHATTLGAVVISGFWSLLNERFDPHTAQRLFSRVAGAASLGAVCGGIAAERVAAYWSAVGLLAALGTGAAACWVGAMAVGRGGEAPEFQDDGLGSAGVDADRATRPYLGSLAAVTILAALVGTLCDYLLKADAASHIVGSEALIRFFGLFYAATGIVAFLIQALLAPGVLGRFGIAGALAVHPLGVGAASLVALALPSPWRGVLPRCADVTLRHSLFRTAYELAYAPLSQAAKRSAKATIDVAWDCLGNGVGAAAVLVAIQLAPAHHVAVVTTAGLLAAMAELASAWRLRPGYLATVEGSLRRRGAGLPHVTHYACDYATMVHIDRRRHEHDSRDHERPTPGPDRIAGALSALLSGDPRRIRPALRHAAHEPLLLGAVIPLLGETDLVDAVAATLKAHGARAAGQLADALLDPSTPDVVRRRLPLILPSCRSNLAFQGLLGGLVDRSFKVRQRCCRALLEMTAADPALCVPSALACAAAERELDAGAGDRASTAHVFDLLALAFDRDMVAIARSACEASNVHVRGTALAYLQAVLPRDLFVKVEQRMIAAVDLVKRP